MSGSAVVRFNEKGFSHVSVIADDVLLPIRGKTASKAPVQIYNDSNNIIWAIKGHLKVYYEYKQHIWG